MMVVGRGNVDSDRGTCMETGEDARFIWVTREDDSSICCCLALVVEVMRVWMPVAAMESPRGVRTRTKKRKLAAEKMILQIKI